MPDEGIGCAAMTVAISVAVLAVASCAAVEKFAASVERLKMTPEQMCVAKAWTHADRLACLRCEGIKP